MLAIDVSASLEGRTPQGAPRGSQQGTRNDNPGTDVAMAGTVEDVRNVISRAVGLSGLHVTVRSNAGVADVRLGPTACITGKHFEPAKGDTDTVVGSEVTVAGTDVVIARGQEGEQALPLRDADGFPLWWRSRRLSGPFR